MNIPTPADQAFTANARKRWEEIIDKTKDWEADRAAIAIALWATINVERLLDIAEQRI